MPNRINFSNKNLDKNLTQYIFSFLSPADLTQAAQAHSMFSQDLINHRISNIATFHTINLSLDNNIPPVSITIPINQQTTLLNFNQHVRSTLRQERESILDNVLENASSETRHSCFNTHGVSKPLIALGTVSLIFYVLGLINLQSSGTFNPENGIELSLGSIGLLTTILVACTKNCSPTIYEENAISTADPTYGIASLVHRLGIRRKAGNRLDSFTEDSSVPLTSADHLRP